MTNSQLFAPTLLFRRFLMPVLLIISTGFAMFSMFFGSGNLVFPIMLGDIVQGHYVVATIGLFVTAVIVPFLGLLGIYLFDGSYEAFFQRMGNYAGFILPLLIIALIGPFGVIPRCITVAYGSLVLLFPNLPFSLFSVGMCVLIFLLTLDPRKMILVIGAVLTPLLLVSLVTIIVRGISGAQLSYPVIGEVSAASEFFTGALQGYLTLDLMAAFFFATVVIKYIRYNIEQKAMVKARQNIIIFASLLFGAGLLAVIYSAFVYLGAAYADILNTDHPEQSITIIANHTLGSLASPIVVLAVSMAVLTTAVTLTSVAATFLRSNLFRDRIYTSVSTLLILVIALFVSTLQFTGIAALLGPILVVLYPGLIVLTVLNIANKLWGVKILKIPVYVVFALSAAWYWLPVM